MRILSSRLNKVLEGGPVSTQEMVDDALLEGKLERETTLIARFVMRALKRELKVWWDIASDGSLLYHSADQGIPVMSKVRAAMAPIKISGMEVVIRKDLKSSYPNDFGGRSSYNVAKDSWNVKIEGFLSDPKDLQTFLNNFKRVLRHELEHVTQKGIETLRAASEAGRNILNSADTVAAYYLSRREVEAEVSGLYKEAKMRNVPLSKTFSEKILYVDHVMLKSKEPGALSNRKKLQRKILKVWTDYAKKRFPRAQFESLRESDG